MRTATHQKCSRLERRIILDFFVGLNRLDAVEVALGDRNKRQRHREEKRQDGEHEHAAFLEQHMGERHRDQREEARSRERADDRKGAERHREEEGARDPLEGGEFSRQHLAAEPEEWQRHRNGERVAVVVDERARLSCGELHAAADERSEACLRGKESDRHGDRRDRQHKSAASVHECRGEQ